MAQAKTAPQAPGKRSPRTLAGFAPAAPDSDSVKALALYESAVQLLQQGKYEKAHAAFDKLLATSPPHLSDRIRMYLSACLGQITRGKTSFVSHEEHYDYAISLLNEGHYEDARKEFATLMEKNGDVDYTFYGMAVLASMTGDADGCLEHLAKAIERNPRNRIQARADSDFQDMTDDPRFTELLYPEV